MTNWRNEFIKVKDKPMEWWLTYGNYLNSPEWKKRRTRILIRDGYQCRICGNANELQIHHVRYDNIGAEKALDLTTLCERCHRPITKFLRSRRVKRGYKFYDNVIVAMPKLDSFGYIK